MSEITQPPPDVPTQDSNTRVNRLSAASDQSTSNKQSAEQNQGQKSAETEQEKPVSHHDPAVTLASTLAKLDSGSHFQATASGHDADGRTIIASELGTYLVETDTTKLSKVQAEEYTKLAKEDQLEIRVLTVDKEIKAELIKTTENQSQPISLPVTLTLTELGQQQPNSQTPTPAPQAPIDDIRSQYQATTLYRAERLAREIGDKLDNLPLPTTSPNYTVYGNSQEPSDTTRPQALQQVSQNVFIQEVSSSATPGNVKDTNLLTSRFNQVLGQNIEAQVLKTVPQTPVPLLQGLPEAVIKELNILSPLDGAVKGQNLVINIAAIAIPEEKSSLPTNSTPQSNSGSSNVTSSSVAVSASPVTKTGAPLTDQQQKQPESTVTIQAAPSETLPQSNQTIISGIVIDPSQNLGVKDPREIPIVPSINSTPYGQKNTAQALTSNQSAANKPYYIATPTAVLKFHSPTPLIAGTIVNFSVQGDQNILPAQGNAPASQSQTPNPTLQSSNVTTTTSSPTEATNSANTTNTTNTVSPTLTDKIDQFFPQNLEQLPEDWSSISLALSALTSTASNAAAAMTSRIPNMLSPEQITSTMFFFLSAIKSTTPARTWVGPDVSSKLRQIGAGRILDRIDHDFTRIARLGAEAPANDWRPTIIPFQNGPDITGVPMIVKQLSDENKGDENQHNNQEDENNIKATRFILEINFSQFGHVLIDGLLKESRLDLIVKASEIIPYAVKAKLSRRFTDALENSNFAGELVIIDEAPVDISIAKMIENMAHKTNIEKQI